MNKRIRLFYLVCSPVLLFSHCSRPNEDSVSPDSQSQQAEIVSRVGGPKNESLAAVIATRDQGFLAVGEYDSLFSVGRTYRGFVVRLDSLGRVIGQQKVAMPFTSVVQTQDGSFWLGASLINGALVKLDEQGRYVSAKSLDNPNAPGGSAINKLIKASDGGYIGVGYTNQAKFNSSLTTNETAGFVIKINEAGDIVWHQTLYFKGTLNIFQSVTPTNDGGYAICGRTTYNYGDAVTYPKEEGIYGWLVKINATGRVVWHKAVPGMITFNEVSETNTGELRIVGSQVGPRPNSSIAVENVIDGWMGRFSADGTLLGQQRYGGGNYDILQAAISLPGGEYLLGGTSASPSGNSELGSGWLVQTNGQGTIQKQKHFSSGPNGNTADGVMGLATNGRRYVAVGRSSIPTSSESNTDGFIFSIKPF